MSALRDEAEALAKALRYGLCEVTDVIAWCDSQILRESSPPLALCEASLAHDRYPEDVAALLRQCPGTPNDEVVNALLLLLCRDRLKCDERSADPIARLLVELDRTECIDDPDLRETSHWAWDALDDGTEYGWASRTDVIAQMVDALDRAVSNSKTATVWSTPIGVDDLTE